MLLPILRCVLSRVRIVIKFNLNTYSTTVNPFPTAKRMAGEANSTTHFCFR